MRVRVLLFAAAADAVGKRSVELQLDQPSSLTNVRDELARAYPQLSPLLSISRWAVDQQFMPLTTLIKPGQELALIPPVSGG